MFMLCSNETEDISFPTTESRAPLAVHMLHLGQVTFELPSSLMTIPGSAVFSLGRKSAAYFRFIASAERTYGQTVTVIRWVNLVTPTSRLHIS
jgi:hypothetical protein